MPRFSLRFNLSDPHQKTAWELLCSVPEDQRSAYVTELLYRSATQTDEENRDPQPVSRLFGRPVKEVVPMLAQSRC